MKKFLSSFLFKMFGETKSLLWIFLISLIGQLLFYGAIIWVVVHFIQKYW